MKVNFLFFSLLCLLVNDDENTTTPWKSNGGITFPDATNATHDGQLSPLFLTRTGEWGYYFNATASIALRGAFGVFWSSTSSTLSPMNTYYLSLETFAVYPSQSLEKYYAYPLRCLVSTNNRIIINLVSDDDTDSYAANRGITLPDDNNATYNSGLSPIFIFRPGGSWLNDQVIGGRGLGVGFWSINARWSTQAYHSGIKGDTMFYPSDRNPRADYAFSLRCLVSTNNRIIINLVSDDDDFIINGTSRPNMGFTLPNSPNATHNVGLSPLFIERGGRSGSSHAEDTVIYRGGNGYLYATNARSNSRSYFIQFDQSDTIWPSSHWAQTVAISLRCLVSTNNR